MPKFFDFVVIPTLVILVIVLLLAGLTARVGAPSANWIGLLLSGYAAEYILTLKYRNEWPTGMALFQPPQRIRFQSPFIFLLAATLPISWFATVWLIPHAEAARPLLAALEMIKGPTVSERILAAFWEEFLFRGVLFVGLLACGVRLIPALLVSTVLFVVMHSSVGPYGMVTVGLGALFFAVSVMIWRSYWAAILLHAVWNMSEWCRQLIVNVVGHSDFLKSEPDKFDITSLTPTISAAFSWLVIGLIWAYINRASLFSPTWEQIEPAVVDLRA